MGQAEGAMRERGGTRGNEERTTEMMSEQDTRWRGDGGGDDRRLRRGSHLLSRQ